MGWERVGSTGGVKSARKPLANHWQTTGKSTDGKNPKTTPDTPYRRQPRLPEPTRTSLRTLPHPDTDTDRHRTEPDLPSNSPPPRHRPRPNRARPPSEHSPTPTPTETDTDRDPPPTTPLPDFPNRTEPPPQTPSRGRPPPHPRIPLPPTRSTDYDDCVSDDTTPFSLSEQLARCHPSAKPPPTHKKNSFRKCLHNPKNVYFCKVGKSATQTAQPCEF